VPERKQPKAIKGTSRPTPNLDETYTTKAKGLGDGLQIGGKTGEKPGATDTIFGAEPRMNVIAKDTYTGELVKIEGVKIKVAAGTALTGIPPDAEFTLTATNYRTFKMNRAEGMMLVPIEKKPTIQNQAIPQPAKVKDTLGSFGNAPSAMCKTLKDNEQMAKKRLGLIHDRTDVKLMQGDNDGRSPGVLVQQEDGKIYMFDGSGKQYIAMDGQRFQVQASGIDTGQALEERTLMGFPAMKNPVNDFVPQGTIVAPQPRLLPHILKLTNTLLTITDMVDLVEACSEAVKVLQEPVPTAQEQIRREEALKEKTKVSTWERKAEEVARKGE
jgi:hypothetical protein